MLLVMVAWMSLTSMTTLKGCEGKATTQSTDESVSEQTPSPVPAGDEVVLGAARTSEYVPLLKGKRVALLSNQTGMVGDNHTLDIMLEQDVYVVTIF